MTSWGIEPQTSRSLVQRPYHWATSSYTRELFSGNQCDDGWTLSRQSCYKSGSEELFYHEALVECEALSASLASIESFNENQVVVRL
jgi:hypothetical protein